MSKYSFPERDLSWAARGKNSPAENLDTLKLLKDTTEKLKVAQKDLYKARLLMSEALHELKHDGDLWLKISKFLMVGASGGPLLPLTKSPLLAMDFATLESKTMGTVLTQDAHGNWKQVYDAVPAKAKKTKAWKPSEVYAVDGKISLDPAGYKPVKIGTVLYLQDCWVSSHKLDMSAYEKIHEESDPKAGVSTWKKVGVTLISATYMGGQLLKYPTSKGEFQIGECFHAVNKTWIHDKDLKSWKNVGKVETDQGELYKFVKINEQHPDAPTEPLPPVKYHFDGHVGEWKWCSTGEPVSDGQYMTIGDDPAIKFLLEGYEFIHELPGGYQVYKKMPAEKPIDKWMVLNGEIAHPIFGKQWEVGDEIVLNHTHKYSFPTHWLAGWKDTGKIVKNHPVTGADGYVYRWVGTKNQ